MTKQQTLKFTQNENTFENFYTGQNEVVVKLLQNITQQNDIFCVYLWGNRGTGKTHLLKACIEEASKRSIKRAQFVTPAQPVIPAKAGIQKSCLDPSFRWDDNQTLYLSATELLSKNLESFSFVVIDNIEYICQKSELEETLFHLYNTLQANNKHLVVSSIHPPTNLPIALPDLKSRLLASYSAMLNTLSDEEKKQILKKRSIARGFNLSEEVMSFIITHFPRDMNKLINILDRIDEASLTEKRVVTVPFIKRIL